MHTYLVRHSVALILCLCSALSEARVSGVSATTGNGSTTSEFVTVRDGKFYIGTDEYRYVGTNLWYAAILASEGKGGNRQRLHHELDDLCAMGIDNVRVLVGGDGRDGIPSHIAPKLQSQPGVYDQQLLIGLDYLLAELEKRDMKVVLYSCGGIEKALLPFG